MSKVKKQITGVMFYYFYVCRRKLWYFYNEISMEHTSENVQLGKLLDETSYDRHDKHINIDNVINIDYIVKEHILHEVKKSKKIEEASIMQLKYYLYYLKIRGVDELEGKIDYPLLKQTSQVDLSEDDVVEIEKTLENINEIVSDDRPPNKLNNKGICNKCAYYEMCYI